MSQQSIKRFSLIGAWGTSAAFALYAGWLFSRCRAPDEQLFSLHEFVISLLIATWLVADTRESRRTQPSFDLGWFVLLAFPFYATYHVIATRGWWRGTLTLTGMIVLLLLPWLARLIAAYVS